MEFDNNIPIYIQVIEKIKKDIILGKLMPGDKIPSSRDFSCELGINLNTVTRIYKELELQSLVYTKRGLGTYVTEDTDKISSLKSDVAHKYVDDFISNMLSIGYSEEEIKNIIFSKLKEETEQRE